MATLFRSKVGYAVAGIYLLITLPVMAMSAVFFVLRYYNSSADIHSIEKLSAGGMVVLTFPWSFFSIILGLIVQGEYGTQLGQVVLAICFIISAILNASILYLLVYFLTKAFNYFYKSRNSKP